MLTLFKPTCLLVAGAGPLHLSCKTDIQAGCERAVAVVVVGVLTRKTPAPLRNLCPGLLSHYRHLLSPCPSQLSRVQIKDWEHSNEVPARLDWVCQAFSTWNGRAISLKNTFLKKQPDPSWADILSLSPIGKPCEQTHPQMDMTSVQDWAQYNSQSQHISTQNSLIKKKKKKSVTLVRDLELQNGPIKADICVFIFIFFVFSSCKIHYWLTVCN